MTIALLLCLALAGAPAVVPSLSVGYRFDNHAAPLFAACLYPAEFKSRYGMYLKEVKRRERYALYDGKESLLELRLDAMESDAAVLSSLIDGSNHVGLLAMEEVMLGTIAGRGTRVIAPLQYKGDMLLVGEEVAAADWTGFMAWVKAQNRQVRVAFLGQEPAAVPCFEQALEYEDVTRTHDPADTVASVAMVRADTWPELARGLSQQRFDAVVVRQPEATMVRQSGGVRMVCEMHDLPPNRFENRPGTVIAATDTTIRARAADIGRFLELMGLATHYANNRTRNTFNAAMRWLGHKPAFESTAMAGIGFSSMPNPAFKDGLWNWYFALRLKGMMPDSLDDFMNRDEWVPVVYDSSLVMPALDRAGARFIK
jgi:ABC-type nitrate/sulfonate/bicarbonate transport system substrate-binding protein